jgi:phosphoribosylaminoimidazole-succinocarboxamide synthase
MQIKKPSVLLKTNLPGIELFSRGKVRDVYVLGDKLLVVATDRLSAFDVVMNEGIPDKGRVLTQLSVFWFNLIKDEIRHHFISARVADYPAELHPFADQLEGRSMLVEKAQTFPIECVVRGYLVGSGWKEYRAKGSVCGIKLPAGLQEASRLETPIFTPSTKATVGHDENITWDETVSRIGIEAAEKLRDLSLKLYSKGREFGESRGIIIADTKFEWGLKDDQFILIDEVLTPDSSRFWPKAEYEPGKAQPSFDKQFVRDYLESIEWNKQPPPPPLPPEVVEKTSEKYREAYRLLTGESLS